MSESTTTSEGESPEVPGPPAAAGGPRWIRWLTRGVLVLAVLFVVFAGVGLLLSDTISLAVQTNIQATPEEIYPWVANLSRWKEWTAWNTRDNPDIHYQYEGPDEGVGAVQRWTEPGKMKGRMEITDAAVSAEDAFVVYKLWFDDNPDPATGRFDIVALPDGSSRVTWSCRIELSMNPVERYLGLFLEGWIRQDFERGLAGLRQELETP